MSRLQKHDKPLSVTTLFEASGSDPFSGHIYREIIEHRLRKILPKSFFKSQGSASLTRQKRCLILKKIIPLVTYSEVKQFPCKLSFLALSKFRLNSFKFFFEMISRWLTPGKCLNVALVYASDFRIDNVSEEIFTFYEIVVHIDEPAEFDQIKHNFPLVQEEIMLGIHSDFYAQRLLEIKGVSFDGKTAIIQNFMAYLLKRFPKIYDIGLFSEMQHLLVTCHDTFKEERPARHLSRMICFQYLFRKKLRQSIEDGAHKRHLLLKIFKTTVKTVEENKNVLSVLLGITFLKEQEVFKKDYFLKAIQTSFPSVQLVEDSYYVHKHGSENICLAYLEVEKKDGKSFSIAQIRKLKQELPLQLKGRIEHQLHPVFMPRNEEEVLRTMLILAGQIKYVRDIPQISVSFDGQVKNQLSFTVVIARILKKEVQALSAILEKKDFSIAPVHDRTKMMGYVRKKYPKEASVLHFTICKEPFIRSDHSIDLYKARHKIVTEIRQVFGEVRDYNGGMISKQQELLQEIKKQLSSAFESYDELLLENFFYSFNPVVRAMVDPEAFQKLFLILVKNLCTSRQEPYFFEYRKEKFYQCALVISEDASLKETISQTFSLSKSAHTGWVQGQVKVYNDYCIGLICGAAHLEANSQFLNQIKTFLNHYFSTKNFG